MYSHMKISIWVSKPIRRILWFSRIKSFPFLHWYQQYVWSCNDASKVFVIVKGSEKHLKTQSHTHLIFQSLFFLQTKYYHSSCSILFGMLSLITRDKKISAAVKYQRLMIMSMRWNLKLMIKFPKNECYIHSFFKELSTKIALFFN